MTPDIIYDQLIGAGCATRLTFSWGGNPGVGSLHRFRDAVEQGWPHALEIEEHSHAGMATRYAAGASGLPFGVLRGYVGTDLPDHTASIKPIACPFTGEQLTAVPALNPDVTVIHAQRADREGNVQIWGLIGIQKEALLSAQDIDRDRRGDRRRTVADSGRDRPAGMGGRCRVCRCPMVPIPASRWATPSATTRSTRRGTTSRSDRDVFTEWINTHVLGTSRLTPNICARSAIGRLSRV